MILTAYSRLLKLEINYKKSGILLITKSKRLQEKAKNKNIQGFTYVSNYKYLGTNIDGSLSTNLQLLAINKKAIFCIIKLTPFRKKGNLRFNSNLFELFVKPSFRLTSALY